MTEAWRPIDTAPKDGTIVMLYASQGCAGAWNGIHVAWWDSDNTSNGYRHCWRHADYQNLGGGVSGNPTHWMPLPRDPHGRCVNDERNKRYPWTKSAYLVTP